jgi:uncharacterized protein YecE (DUF72 family)
MAGNPSTMEAKPTFFLGCPVWASPEWRGRVFTAGAPRSKYLHQYSLAFNTVEGNSTFYGLPNLDAVRRWGEETAPGFRFALKFPRAISHERELVQAGPETQRFLSVLEVLRQSGRLGPSFLQLPPRFGSAQFAALSAYLHRLPREYPYAVEVRHRSFYDAGPVERDLDSLLTSLGIDRVLLDSRPLFRYPPMDSYEEEAQRQKPRSPLRQTVTGTRPMLRLIGRDEPELVQPWIDEWAPIVAGWIKRGWTPYVFTHAPHDKYAPDLARQFHQTVRRHFPALPPLPPWPGEEEVATARGRPGQRMLFE